MYTVLKRKPSLQLKLLNKSQNRNQDERNVPEPVVTAMTVATRGNQEFLSMTAKNGSQKQLVRRYLTAKKKTTWCAKLILQLMAVAGGACGQSQRNRVAM